MGTLLFIVFVGLTFLGILLYKNSRDEVAEIGSIALIVIAGIVAMCFFVYMLKCMGDINKLKYVDERISIYEEQNEEIENDISVMVENYMKYESETYSQFKNDNDSTNVIAMVQLYPELKANELVQQQIQVYTSNNAEIKRLYEEKINYKPAKWWLYFGG